MRLLFDQNVPKPLAAHLNDHDVTRSAQRGWGELANGNLIAAGDAAGFEVLVTCDQSIEHQQNMSSRRIGLVVLSSNLWLEIRAHLPAVVAAIEQAGAGRHIRVEVPPLPLNRRPPPDRAP